VKEEGMRKGKTTNEMDGMDGMGEWNGVNG